VSKESNRANVSLKPKRGSARESPVVPAFELKFPEAGDETVVSSGVKFFSQLITSNVQKRTRK